MEKYDPYFTVRFLSNQSVWPGDFCALKRVDLNWDAEYQFGYVSKHDPLLVMSADTPRMVLERYDSLDALAQDWRID